MIRRGRVKAKHWQMSKQIGQTNVELPRSNHVLIKMTRPVRKMYGNQELVHCTKQTECDQIV